MLPALEDDEAGVAAVAVDAEARRTTFFLSRWDVSLVQGFSPIPAIDAVSTGHRNDLSATFCASALRRGSFV